MISLHILCKQSSLFCQVSEQYFPIECRIGKQLEEGTRRFLWGADYVLFLHLITTYLGCAQSVPYLSYVYTFSGSILKFVFEGLISKKSQ